MSNRTFENIIIQERLVRGLFGIATIIAAITPLLTWSVEYFMLLNAIGLYVVFTGLIGWDPVYGVYYTLRKMIARIRIIPVHRTSKLPA